MSKGINSNLIRALFSVGAPSPGLIQSTVEDYLLADPPTGTQGPQGIPGTTGQRGADGAQGIQGLPGQNGATGQPGADGYTPIKGVDYFDGSPGTPGVKGDPGNQGVQGIQGIPGPDPFIAKLLLASDKPTGANTTPVILGLPFAYEANKTYVIDIFSIVAPTAAGTGCGFLIDVSTAVTYVGTFTIHQLAATGTVSGGSSIGDLGATAMGVSSGMVGTGLNFVSGSALLVTGANSGVANPYFRSETTAVTTCKAGTAIRVMKMN